MNNLRSCAYSKKKDFKYNMFRVVKTPSHEIKIDVNYSISGRGAYLCKEEEIIKLAKAKNSLARVLKCNVDPSIYDELIKLL